MLAVHLFHPFEFPNIVSRPGLTAASGTDDHCRVYPQVVVCRIGPIPFEVAWHDVAEGRNDSSGFQMSVDK